ncbi:unnamed protein product, partial [Arabidopsis halleri]
KTGVISIPKDQLVDFGDYQEEKVGFEVNQGKVTLSLNDMELTPTKGEMCDVETASQIK